MYINLVDSYRLQRGWSQGDLARMLNVSDAYISYVLNTEPAPLMDKLLSREQERRLVELLDINPVRRDLLACHLAAARRDQVSGAEQTWLSPDDIHVVLAQLPHLHGRATFAASPGEARGAYVQLWDAANQLVGRIDPRRNPMARVNVLLYLHDADCVLDRADLALGHAREALGILEEGPPGAKEHDSREWARVQATRAEIVALNNLGLPVTAQEVAKHVEDALPGFQAERTFWLPQLYGDRLSSLSRLEGVRRFAISEAEILREQADRVAASSDVTAALLDNGLARAFLAHGSPRSFRKALPLVEAGLRRASSSDEKIGPLHRALLLRTAARYEWKTGGKTATWEKLLRQCLGMVASGGLAHQRAELERQYGADEIDRLASGDQQQASEQPVTPT